MKEKLVIYWSRRDFRLRDNRALLSAVNFSEKENIPFLPLFIIEPYMTEANPKYQFGYPSRFFLANAISAFGKNFKSFLLVEEKAVKFFIKLSKYYEVNIFVNEDIHPDFYTQIKKIKDQGINIKLYRDQITIDKEVRTGNGGIYSIFTPFKKAVWNSLVNTEEDKKPKLDKVKFFNLKNFPLKYINTLNSTEILKLFKKQESILIENEIIKLEELDLPKRDLSIYSFNEEEMILKFKKFLKNTLSNYKDERDYLDIEGTSRMSLALSWGLVSSRTLVKLIQNHFNNKFENYNSSRKIDEGPIHFINELIWREFYKYLLFHKPNLLSQAFQTKYNSISWAPKKQSKERFLLWIKGQTGYPIVDAAMNELAKTGYMHNRARMIVSSVLTKNLGVNWLWGQEYFRAMLIDLDEASNNGGWQWGASVGADPKPIRIFNPYLQAENYDKDNKYQNKWLSKEYLTNPPLPIIEHKEARKEALKRYGLSKE